MQKLLIGTVPQQEIAAAKKVISELQDYKNRYWAIGLNGDTLQPDGFLRFFNARNLPFQHFVRSQGVAVGEQSAYDDNIATLNQYIKQVRDQEISAVEGTINELLTYQNRYWAIGLNGDTLEPDGFVRFFNARNLPFQYFVRSQGLALGEQSAYDENIATLRRYIESLSD
ncbi:MAG: hypothetical protein AB4352_16080 [Hormoscilla sp.]